MTQKSADPQVRSLGAGIEGAFPKRLQPTSYGSRGKAPSVDLEALAWLDAGPLGKACRVCGQAFTVELLPGLERPVRFECSGCGADFLDVEDEAARLIAEKSRIFRPRVLIDDRPDPVAQLAAALRLWESASPIALGSPAARYLLARGGILPGEGADLRWVASLRHGPSGRRFPCLLGLVTDATDASRPMTLHRTFLAVDGSGKAPVSPARMLWGGLPKAGGCIRLVADDEIGDGLSLAEGIENALVGLRAGLPTWACIDAGNMAGFPLLPGITSLTVIADHDAAGIKAADSLADRWRAGGREVRVWQAENEGDDLADIATIMDKRAAA